MPRKVQAVTTRVNKFRSPPNKRIVRKPPVVKKRKRVARRFSKVI